MTGSPSMVCIVSPSPKSSGGASRSVSRSLEQAAAAIGWREAIDDRALPAIARGLREREGHRAVCVLPPGGRDDALAWLDSNHASGWISTTTRREVDALAAAIDDALNRGFVAADAVLLGFASGELPRLSYGPEPAFASMPRANTERPIGLYAIVDSSEALRRAVDAGVTTVQLRIKRPVGADAAWHSMLAREAEAALAATAAGGAELVLNDHWKLAGELGIGSVHLGQEDLVALGRERRAALAASGLRLGVSSHSVWELCRARSLSTRYIACGPVWATTTKDMPWIPQGPDNLAWWCAHAGRPVVAIGGILEPEQARIAARSGADGVCLVRALGDEPARVIPAFRDAYAAGRAERGAMDAPAWPHPTLPQPGQT